MNAAHMLGRLRNRLARLRKKIPDAPADKQGALVARVKEIEELLRNNKV